MPRPIRRPKRCAEDARNSLRVSDYFIDASVSGEGALVTYFQT